MSHSTVLVVIRDAANAGEAFERLEVLLEPFDENKEVEGYPEYQTPEQVDRIIGFYRENPEFCPGSDDGAGSGPMKPFDGFVGQGDLEALHEWTRQAVGAYCGNGRDDGLYDPEKDQFYYLSRYNPDSRWDWWQLGGRWHGMWLVKEGVHVGAEPLPAWRTQARLGMAHMKGRKEGTLDIETFDGTQQAILGISGTGGDDENENFAGRADLARKDAIDFHGMRSLAGQQAEATYDEFEKATEGLVLAERWSDLTTRVLIDNNVDPDAEPSQMTKEEWEAHSNKYREALDKARAEFGEQPWVKALREAQLAPWFTDIHDHWCVFEGGRKTYVQRSIDGATSTFAVLLDGEWHERGHMGWFGMASGEVSEDQWLREHARMIDSLPDDAYLAVVDVHI